MIKPGALPATRIVCRPIRQWTGAPREAASFFSKLISDLINVKFGIINECSCFAPGPTSMHRHQARMARRRNYENPHCNLYNGLIKVTRQSKTRKSSRKIQTAVKDKGLW
jgi:hypothetical protein